MDYLRSRRVDAIGLSFLGYSMSLMCIIIQGIPDHGVAYFEPIRPPSHDAKLPDGGVSSLLSRQRLH